MRRKIAGIAPKVSWYRFVSYTEEREPVPVCHIHDQFRFHRSQQYSMAKAIQHIERIGLKVGFQL